MANSKFSSAKIAGIVTVVPEKIKCIDDEVENYGGNEKQIQRIKKAIGLNQRHVVEGNVTSLDLCLEASKKLFEGLDFDKSQIDGVIFVTQTPDHFQPSNAAIIHGKLGLSTEAASFDVSLGCSGFVYGLWLAHMMIASGSCKNILLLAGDTLSRCVNKRDRATAPLFGDAGTATLVQSAVDTDSFFSLHTDGSGYQHIVQPAGGFRLPFSDAKTQEVIDEEGNFHSDADIQMNGGEVFNFSIKTEPKAITDILSYSNTCLDEVDFVFFHQANQYIISNIIRRLKIPKEKAPSDIVSIYGNQSSASIPCSINHSLKGKLLESPLKVVLSGFGVGLSWASAVIKLNNTYCPDVFIFNKSK